MNQTATSPDHIILITLRAPGFGAIPCKPIPFDGTREAAIAYGRTVAREKSEFLGAKSAKVEVLS